MSAVRGSECVIDIDLSHGSKLFCECGIVLFLFLVEADVFDHHDLAGLERGCLCLCILTDNVGGKDNLLSEKLGETLCNGSEGESGIEFALRSAHVGAEDDCRILRKKVLDGRESAVDSCLVGDLAVLHRYVEVAAHEDFLSGYVDIFDAFLVVRHVIYQSFSVNFFFP